MEINNEDIRVDVYEKHGVKITHLKTGIIVAANKTNSQVKNLQLCKDALYTELQKKKLYAVPIVIILV